MGFAAVLLGCGAPSQPPSPGAYGSDTSAVTTAARTFLSPLSDTQQAATAFSFGDPERINWAYAPRERGGIPLRAMNAEQRAAALGLLGSGLSE